MKKITVKTIGELTQHEITEFLINETVQDDIVKYAQSSEMVKILEYYNDFETVEYESDYINHYLEFHFDTEVALTSKGVTFIHY